MKHLVYLVCLASVSTLLAQGPPITADKPIMLGANSFTAKTLVEIRNTERGTAVYIPLMLHYVPSANTEVAFHIPYVSYDLGVDGQGDVLADMALLGKYQFYRKDATGKTFRMAAKSIQTLPTGRELDLTGLSTGTYAGYYGVVSGYESLKYGISAEVGYNWMPGGTLDEFMVKLGIGLPLLKPQYPNKQLNLFFEYSSSLFTERDGYRLLYAQGVQYAGKNITFDLALQLPFIQELPEGMATNYSVFLGTRYTF